MRPTEHLGPTLAVAVAAGALTWTAPSAADACTPARCQGGNLSVDSADVPANLSSFTWKPKVDRTLDRDEIPDDLQIGLVDTRTETSVAISTDRVGRASYRVDLDEPLDPGRQYRFESAQKCPSADDYTATFEATARAPRPSSTAAPSAGPLRLGDQTIVASGASCGYPTEEIDSAYRRVRVPETPAMEPWREVWRTTAQIREVGEQKFRNWDPPATVERPADDREGLIETTLLTTCEPSPETGYVVASVDPGRYEVRFRMTLPGTGWRLSTPPKTVSIQCGGTDEVEPDGGEDVGLSADTGPDTGSGGPDSGGEAGIPEWEDGQESAGCGGCSTTAHTPFPTGLAAIFVAGFAAARNRERTHGPA